jgi:hypothetical protein
MYMFVKWLHAVGRGNSNIIYQRLTTCFWLQHTELLQLQ